MYDIPPGIDLPENMPILENMKTVQVSTTSLPPDAVVSAPGIDLRRPWQIFDEAFEAPPDEAEPVDEGEGLEPDSCTESASSPSSSSENDEN